MILSLGNVQRVGCPDSQVHPIEINCNSVAISCVAAYSRIYRYYMCRRFGYMCVAVLTSYIKKQTQIQSQLI